MGRQGLLDSAAILAVASAGLYLVGHFYLTSFYGRLGLAETQLHFDVPFTMSKSFLSLLHPVVFLILAVFLFSGLPPLQDRHDAWRPFHPLPASKVVAVVLVTWAAKIFADQQYPSADGQWIAWDQRDVLFFFAGTAILAALYTSYWMRRVLKKNPVLTSPTTGIAWLIGVPVLMAILFSILQHKWILSAWRTALVVLGIAWLGRLIWLDLKTWPERKKDHTPVSGPPGEHTIPSRGSTLMLYTVAGLALFLAAGLQGSVDAQRASDGCESVKTVSFYPPLQNVDANHTYWLVLHHDGMYYLRDLPPNSSNMAIAVPEEPGRAASIGIQPSSSVC